MRKTPLPYGGQKKCPGAEMHFWFELYAIDCWCITSLRKYGSRMVTLPNNNRESFQTNSICVGSPKSEPLPLFLCFTYQKRACSYMRFFTWDTTQANHFIWVSLLGHATSEPFHINFFTWDIRHKWTTEFLYLGHATSEPLHMSFFTWDTLQANHFIFN